MDETTRQCPYCELRFEYHGEIKDHIMRDHPDRADVVVASILTSCHTRDPVTGDEAALRIPPSSSISLAAQSAGMYGSSVPSG